MRSLKSAFGAGPDSLSYSLLQLGICPPKEIVTSGFKKAIAFCVIRMSCKPTAFVPTSKQLDFKHFTEVLTSSGHLFLGAQTKQKGFTLLFYFLLLIVPGCPLLLSYKHNRSASASSCIIVSLFPKCLNNPPEPRLLYSSRLFLSL